MILCHKRPIARRHAVFACGLFMVASGASAGDGEAGTARRLADPLTGLDHLSVRFDWDTQIGGFDEGKRQTFAVEPSFSFDLDGGGRLVSRTLVPVIRLDGVPGDDPEQTGLGDVVQTLYYVPAVAAGSGFHWGIGASLRVPSASDDALGRDGTGLGPAVAASWVGERWTWGAQLQHQVIVGGDGDDLTVVQPFVVREFGRGWSSGIQVDATYEWERDRLKGPLTLYARKAFPSGSASTYAFDAGFRYWVDGPTEEPEWGVRVGFAWVF